jgi:two-component system chemotaxis sensor kinase CheA
MDIFDDELIADYVEESREHLANIESDLLVIEEQGENINLDLVNKVFRAAHSIKGGAGFLNLNTVKDLSHKIENVLCLVRNRELVPTPDVVNVMLISFDKLRELINNLQESNQADVSVLLTSLSMIIAPERQSGAVPDAIQEETVQIPLPHGVESIAASRFDLNQAAKDGNSVFLAEFDLIHDVQRLWRTPYDLIRTIDNCGCLLESMVPLMAVGTLDDEPANRIPFYALISSSRSAQELATELKISLEMITVVSAAARPSNTAALAATPSYPPLALSSAVPSPAPAADSTLRIDVARLDSLMNQAGEMVKERNQLQVARRNDISPTPAANKLATSPVAIKADLPAVPAVDSTLRINVAVLDTLMNLAGEMVLGRNQLLQAISRTDANAIKAAGYRINTVTSELQEAIMLTRMQPIGTIFNRFTRIVRDLARDLGKEINLAITGKEVELDKTIIEGLSDPLTHLVRNAVDHGIESPEKRCNVGKPVAGSIQLNAFHEAGQVIIEIVDDGGGIDPEKVAAAAVSKGLITPEQSRTMSDKEKRFLIMMPGFSTAEKVTEISGRGVGMDVVKNNIERLNGLIEIESELGKGSVFRIKLPLTLAIIPSLFVEAGEQRFAIPQANVVETIRIAVAQIKERIEQVGDANVLMLRGSILPVIHLADALDISRSRANQETFDTSPAHWAVDTTNDLNLVIVNTGIMQYGVVVHKLYDSEEIVVKPLGRHLKHIREFAGATIMGDGKVALILNTPGLAATSGIDAISAAAHGKKQIAAAATNEAENQALLTFFYGSGQQLAVPLELVARVEKIEPGDVENVGGRRVMQYRGQIMPLVMVNDTANMNGPDSNDSMVVIVFEVAGHEVGLVANNPVDSAECRVEIDHNLLRQPGIMGSVILRKKTVLIVDIFELAETMHPDWFAERRMIRGGAAAGKTVLLAEDSAFFRAQVKKFMEDEGYKVIACEDGLLAWQALDRQSEPIHLVVTDIEMPNLNGYELTKRIRADARFRALPVIAVTSLAGDEDIERGRQAGLTNYLVKLDREKLLEAIAATSFN